MKPRELSNGQDGENPLVSVASLETVLWKDLPNLVHHCALTRYEGGAPRAPGWLIIRSLGSIWQVSIKDPDSCLQICAVGLTLDEALATANVLLATDNGPWEVDPYLQHRPKGKRR